MMVHTLRERQVLVLKVKGETVKISVVRIRSNTEVRIGLEVDPGVTIEREELPPKPKIDERPNPDNRPRRAPAKHWS